MPKAENFDSRKLRSNYRQDSVKIIKEKLFIKEYKENHHKGKTIILTYRNESCVLEFRLMRTLLALF